MHNLDDKHPTRSGLELSRPTSEFRATTGSSEPSGGGGGGTEGGHINIEIHVLPLTIGTPLFKSCILSANSFI